MQFSLIIIGDEILSGHRQDKHFEHVLGLIKARGLALSSVQYLGDDRELITLAMRRAIDSGQVVFSCGGIGATPDDHTRQSVAAALGVPLALHPIAADRIAQRCADRGEPDMTLPENQSRLKMGEFPVGADIIENPYNKIPGFSVAGHSNGQANGGRLYCVPGFPVMAWPMIEAVLDTSYAHLFHSQVQLAEAFLVYNLPESAITPLMEQVERECSPAKAYSLPSVGDANGRPNIELGAKSLATAPEALAKAMVMLRAGVEVLGGEIRAM